MSESARVYVLNRRVDPNSDIGDIRLALYYTPIYCTLIDSIYDLDLAKEFADPTGIYLRPDGAKPVMEIAWEYAEESDMAVLVLGEAPRLDAVKKDGTRECICS